MKTLLLMSFFSLLVACSFPQTRHEFVSKVSAGAGLSSVDSMVINNSLNTVVNRLNSPVRNCLNVKVTKFFNSSGGTGFRTTRTFKTELKKLSSRKAVFTLQKTIAGSVGPKPPKGGHFEIAIDLNAVSKNKTKATIYIGTTTHYDIVKEINGVRAQYSLTLESIVL